ncbi:MAG: nucleotidyltransferase domain-containing protein [bacterium]
MTQAELLQRIKERLQALYGARFRGLVLYGSAARGDAREDSDLDILCILDGIRGGETSEITRTTYPLQLEFLDRIFHILPVDTSEYEAGEFGFYRIVRREGITV